MALKSGFFDSVNGDRTYNAEDFNRFLDGIITDGVFTNILIGEDNTGSRFEVDCNISGTTVTAVVHAGKAIFDHVWIYNDDDLSIPMQAAHTTLDRIDAVIFTVDKANRSGNIEIVTGTPASNPANPSVSNTSEITKYVLAYIRVHSRNIGTAEVSMMIDNTSVSILNRVKTARVAAPIDHISTSVPLMDSGSGSVGTSEYLARGDHRHPTDTSRQAKITANGILQGDGNGNVTAATVTSTSTPLMDGTATAGSATTFARSDHRHPTDTSRQAAKKTLTVSLSASGWTNKQQRVAATGVTASNLVVVSPAPASWDAARIALVRCASQESGYLTFACSTVPSVAITMNVVIWD